AVSVVAGSLKKNECPLDPPRTETRATGSPDSTPFRARLSANRSLGGQSRHRIGSRAAERRLNRVPGDLTEGDHWERTAGWWQDEFTDGVDPEYTEQILPLARRHLAGARRVLYVGCGEGQVGRLAAEDGAAVVGVDPTWAQLVVAGQRAGGPSYAQARAEALPFGDNAFDAAVACLVFEHIADMPSAIAELGRVLADGGRFVFFLNHPLLQTPNSGWI